MAEKTLNALTIDVEDYYQVSAFEGLVDRDKWEAYPSRVEANTRRLLDVLARHGVHGTFFVLGWVGRRYPGLVREIAGAGHEIGCHSFWHRLVYRQRPEEFREDLILARDVLQDATGRAVRAYRAPSFSVVSDSLWALDILHEEGFHYDSSIFPIRHDRYGMPGADPLPHAVPCRTGQLWEFPPAVARIGPWNLPIAGGGYFRLYPLWWTSACYRRINRRGRPVMFYLHPWEIDPDQPRMPGSRRAVWRHYLNLAATERKLEGLLSRFRFGTLTEALQRWQADRTPSSQSAAMVNGCKA